MIIEFLLLLTLQPVTSEGTGSIISAPIVFEDEKECEDARKRLEIDLFAREAFNKAKVKTVPLTSCLRRTRIKDEK